MELTDTDFIRPAFVLAGTNSGCGKTTTMVGLLAVLAGRGLRVQAFKAGPDYIDPAFHARVLKRPSYNLDTQMLGVEACRYLFAKHTRDCDIAVVEGVMGLFDGMGAAGKGSTAELAKALQLPVVLVVNATGMYQSVAAIVKGFVDYDPMLNIAGVILNQVSSPAVYAVMKACIEEKTSVACLGYLPRVPEAAFESRHLGLVQAQEIEELDVQIECLRSAFAPCLDVERLQGIARQMSPNYTVSFDSQRWHSDLSGLRLGVAYDNAFSFYYADNLELLQEQGAELLYFSPLADTALPNGCNALYFGGGYPEVFAAELAANVTMLASVREAVNAGIPAFGECGGLMYLCDGIVNRAGEITRLVGVFNAQVYMTAKLVRFGYCVVNWGKVESAAHEFHRSDVRHGERPNYTLDYAVQKPDGLRQWLCGLRYKHTLAGYAHIHFYASPNFYLEITDLWTKHRTQL